jgi:hypothetical protein
MCGQADGMDYLGFATYGLGRLWMSRVRVPGVDLPEDVSYQVAEAELMKKADYDTILEKGWLDFFMDFMANRAWKDVNPDYLPMNQPPFDAKTMADPLGITPILHLDSDWTRDPAFFRELPAKSCIPATDGYTDIFKAKDVLGDHFCIMGDVPASMLSMSTPDKTYTYCTKLTREIGPEGFILHSGCDIPLNAKLENVRAMISAANDS